MRFLYLLAVVLATVSIGSEGRKMAGGRQQYDLSVPSNLEKIEKLSTIGVAQIATQRMKEAKNSVSSSHPAILEYNHRVVSAESQVVAGKLNHTINSTVIYFIYLDGFKKIGVNFYIKIKMNDANCRRFCTVETCDMIVYERAWENFVNMTSFNCITQKTDNMVLSNPSPKKAVLIGQVKKTQLDEKSQAALDHVMNRINMGMNSMFVHKIMTVADVRKQLVAGMKYTFKFQIGQTTCTDKGTTALETCDFEANSTPLDCTASVVDKVWMRERYSNIDFNCNKSKVEQ